MNDSGQIICLAQPVQGSNYHMLLLNPQPIAMALSAYTVLGGSLLTGRVALPVPPSSTATWMPH